VVKVFLTQAVKDIDHWRDDTGNNGAVESLDIYLLNRKEAFHQQVELVLGGIFLRSKAPMMGERITVENTKYRVRIAYING
jgi:hypothetical protein